MHRFGRSAQQKMKDRWGGGFILATILALVGAWYLGTYISNTLGAPGSAADFTQPNVTRNTPGTIGNGSMNMVMEPREFQLFFVQTGAFRSEASARNLARTLSEQGYAAMVAPKSADNLYRVMAGPYTSNTAAADAKGRLSADIQGAYTVPVTVEHNPDAVPAAAMGSMGDDIRKGLDLLNSYLYEAAAWIENRSANNTADATNVAVLGQQLNEYVLAMQGDQEANVQQFVTMAAAASENAAAIETAATAMPTSDEYMAAMNGYMSLLDQYRAFHAGK